MLCLVYFLGRFPLGRRLVIVMFRYTDVPGVLVRRNDMCLKVGPDG